MKIISYPKDSSYHLLFEEVRTFIRNQNESTFDAIYHWSRWEWYIARKSFIDNVLSKNRIFYNDHDEIIGVCLLEDEPNIYYYQASTSEAKKEIIKYVINMNASLMIGKHDKEMIELAKNHQFIETNYIEHMSCLTKETIDTHFNNDYQILSFEEDYNVRKHHQCLWDGFNHEGIASFDEKSLSLRQRQVESPHFKKKYAYIATYHDQYAAFASIWYEKNTKIALIEPVATSPNHRRKGLAKALISRCIDAVKKDGATHIYVGSNQPFYLSIGFEVIETARAFKRNNC